MKKVTLLLALIAFVFMANRAAAQVAFSLGPKVGLNFSTISYDPDINLPAGVTRSGQTNIMFGAVAEIGFANMFAIRLEPGYTQKGDKFEQGSAKITNTASFLEIPVLFKVLFLQGPVKPYAFAGPSIGFTLSSKSKTEGVGQGFDGEVDRKSTTSSTEFGITFGGGAEFKVAPKVALTGDVRYSLGLSNLDNSPTTPGVASTSVKTRGFQILFGALFRI